VNGYSRKKTVAVASVVAAGGHTTALVDAGLGREALSRLARPLEKSPHRRDFWCAWQFLPNLSIRRKLHRAGKPDVRVGLIVLSLQAMLANRLSSRSIKKNRQKTTSSVARKPLIT